MAITQVKTLGIADDAVTEDKVANDAISTAEMKAGTDGHIITYDASGNPTTVGPGTDGQVLTSTGAGSPPAFETLPASNNYTHPNHSGEVTSTADGAQVIASNVVDEDNLKSDNSPTDDHVLTAKASAAGGFTWAAIPASGTPTNLLINGDMIVAQRQTSLTMAHDGTTSGYGVDRWALQMHNADEFDGTFAQVGDDPTGEFTKCVRWTTGTAESAIANDEYVMVRQHIESQNLQHLRWGNAAAKQLTLQFWVKSSITGTYGCSFYSGRSSGTRVINTTYAISSANTWEQKTITIAADTGGSVLNNDNEAGLSIIFPLASGSDFDGTNSTSWADYSTANYLGGHAQDGVVTTAGATWQITGVQVETGNSAGSYAHQSYAKTYEQCRRYYMSGGGWPMFADRTTDAHNCGRTGMYWFPVIMRAAPTMSNLSMTVYSGSAQTLGTQTITKEWVWFNHTGSFSDGREWCLINSFTASAEL